MTARDKTYVWKRWSRQNDSHRITVVTQRNSWKSNIFDPDSIYFEEEKIKRASSGTHFVSKNNDFNNGNSLRMTEQKDISPC